MNCTKSMACLIAIYAISACQISTSILDEEAIKEAVASVLDQQVLAWNQGDVETNPQSPIKAITIAWRHYQLLVPLRTDAWIRDMLA